MDICAKCGREPVIHIRYSGSDLCGEHFAEFVEARVRKEIKLQGKLAKESKLAIAVSGGKDSMSVLSILSETFGPRSGIELVTLIVDEGLEGYRRKAIKLAEDFCSSRDIPCEVMGFEESFGITMDRVAGLGEEWRPCTFCGVLRRSLLNRRARELGAVKIAFGHNLDDMSQSVLMNIVNGDIQRMVRLGPHTKVQDGLVPRMLPLRLIPESEMVLYANLKKIPFLESHCPYRPRAHRLGFLELINRLEEETPGTKHSILSSYDQIIPALREHYPPAKLNQCEKCGEPTMGTVCKACELLGKVRGALSEST
jgi:uncharacterized protein (TIGR00269 family)